MKAKTLKTVLIMKRLINSRKAYFYDDHGVEKYTYPSRGWMKYKDPCTEEELAAEIAELEKPCRIIGGQVDRL